MEDLLHDITSSKRQKSDGKGHDYNVISEYTVSTLISICTLFTIISLPIYAKIKTCFYFRIELKEWIMNCNGCLHYSVLFSTGSYFVAIHYKAEPYFQCQHFEWQNNYLYLYLATVSKKMSPAIIESSITLRYFYVYIHVSWSQGWQTVFVHRVLWSTTFQAIHSLSWV